MRHCVRDIEQEALLVLNSEPSNLQYASLLSKSQFDLDNELIMLYTKHEHFLIIVTENE